MSHGRVRVSLVAVCRVAALAAMLAGGLAQGRLSVAPAWAANPRASDTLDLTDEQVKAITIGPVGYQIFPVQETATGNIDFNEDMQSQVFPPYQGKLMQLFARTGDHVQKGQALFTIDSPDLVQAESTLIGDDATLRLTDRALARARDLYRKNGMAQKDYDQAISDQQTAEGALRAARDGVRIFGKSDAEIDRIIASRKVDPTLIARSPISGVVVARSGAPGVFVQPGTAPAPFTVADTSTMWMVANAPEDLGAVFKIGQPVSADIPAYPGRVFTGKIVAIGATIDPNTRRFFLRSEIADPDHSLRSGMFANFTVTTGDPIRSLAVPLNGVAREGDGTMSVWVTTNRRHFVRRSVTIGRAAQGYREITGGLTEGELVVTDGAVFLSNMLTADPT
jgi:cobalt-zinc-cadmium efflux system membrane fusion protein